MAQIDNAILDKVQTFIHRLKHSGISVELAYLFGSYATNHVGKQSDIDVAIVSPDFSNDRFDDRVRLMKLSIEVDSRIEPVPFHSRDFIDSDPLVGEIKKHGISLSMQLRKKWFFFSFLSFGWGTHLPQKLLLWDTHNFLTHHQ